LGARERNNLEDLCVNWRIILKRIFKKWEVGLYWIYLTQDGKKLQAFINTVIKHPALKNAEIFLTICGTVRFLRKGSAPWS
jgi:hypothetical protein